MRDTVRRDSKIPSSLDFTYIDETCEKLVKNNHPDFPIEKVKSEPITPVVDKFPSWNSQCKASGPSHEGYKYSKEDKFHSEVFDDSDLKPKPEIDSPYGFVFFPNKYWKLWHKKPPVCTPTSKCKVLPTYTEGTPVDVLDYTQVGSIMPKFDYHEEFDNNCSHS